MAGRIAAKAEIAGRADDAGSEVMHPDTINYVARGKRVRRINDGTRYIQPAGAIAEHLLIAAAETAQEVRRRERSGVVGITPHEDMHRLRIRDILDRHGTRRRPVVGSLGQHAVVPDAYGTRVVAVAFGVYQLEFVD